MRLIDKLQLNGQTRNTLDLVFDVLEKNDKLQF